MAKGVILQTPNPEELDVIMISYTNIIDGMFVSVSVCVCVSKRGLSDATALC